MSPRPTVRSIRTQLTSVQWELPDGNIFTLRIPSTAILTQIDGGWPTGRRGDDGHLNWKWREIFKWTPETFCLLDTNGYPAGVWASLKPSVTLRGVPFYRLDRIEANPLYRGGIIGIFLFSLVAVHALEIKTKGIVLGALPTSTKFYERLGGERRLHPGWATEPDLIPFVFAEKRLLELKEYVDDLIIT